MAGITAVSATTTLGASEALPDNSVSDFVSKEQISLGLSGSPTSATWSLSKPSRSGSACALDDDTSLRPKFSPDVDGIYVVSCLVDESTTYVLRISVAQTAIINTISCLHFLPCANSQIPTPSSGVNLFYSSDSDSLAQKRSDGTVQEIQTA